MAFTKVNSGPATQSEDFSFENENDSIEGYLMEIVGLVGKKGRMKGKPFNKYILQTENGSENFLGGTVLDKELTKVTMGTKVRVTYLGIPEGKNYKNFLIEQDADDRVTVSGTPTTAADVIKQARASA